ncbi:hypothetical protein BaRGS_00017634 [Batillaria attramentaria]|uniref:Uncharacterized protein n=1 Tax=Batillaria attramentaria TaxID=370345 RepID=A0ABD0KV68_9CAEN
MDEQFVPKLEVQPSETSQYAPATRHQTVSDTDDKETDTKCRVHSVVIKTEPHDSPASFEHEEEMNTEGCEHKETKCRVHRAIIKTEPHDSPVSFEHEEEMNTEGYEHKETKYEFLTEDDTSGLYLSGAEPADDSFAVFMEEKKTVSVGSYVEASTSTDVGRSLGSVVVESVSGRESDRKTGLPERSATQSGSTSTQIFTDMQLTQGRQKRGLNCGLVERKKCRLLIFSKLVLMY